MGLAHDMAFVSAALVSSPFWAFRLLATGKWRTDWPARFGRCPQGPANGRATILIHAVSVGEVNAIQPLVQELRRQTDWNIVISSTTNTGVTRARKIFEPAHRVVRYPFDLSPAVASFLDSVRPALVALVELEVWPNFIEQCGRRGIQVSVINGRLSARSFARYRRVRPLVRQMFSGLAAAAVQSERYGQRFAQLGVPDARVRFVDSMKWDMAGDTANVEEAATLGRALGIDTNRPVIVAGSTAPGEEQLLVDTCPDDAQLVLVPRRPERFEQVAQLDSAIVRRSSHPDGTVRAPDPQTRLFLIDTMGELLKAYALADVAIVGRSFLGLFGSNVLEPIGLGKPTIVGPHHDDFADTVKALQDGDGIVVTDRPGAVAEDLLRDRRRSAALAAAGTEVIRSHQGATQRHVDLLKQLMPVEAGESRRAGEQESRRAGK